TCCFRSMDVYDLRKCTKLNNSKTYYCFICDKNYSTEESIYLHYQLHLKYKPYKCYDCNASFIDNISLEEHSQEYNHFDTKEKINYKIEHFLNYITGLSFVLKSLSIDEIKKSKLIMVDRSTNKFICSSDNEANLDVERNTSGMGEVSNDKYGSNFNLSKMLLNSSNQNDDNRRMKNTGYLDMKMLNLPEYVKEKNISMECRRCKLKLSNVFSMIVHVFKYHLKIDNFYLLKCAICSRKIRDSDDYMDFDSIREHFENNKTIHKGIEFVNNLSYDYNGKDICIRLNGDFNILEIYEKEFEKCFVDKLKDVSNIPESNNLFQQDKIVNNNLEGVEKQNGNNYEEDVIIIDDSSDENDAEIVASDNDSDIEVLYDSQIHLPLDFTPQPPKSLTPRSDNQSISLDPKVSDNYIASNHNLPKSSELPSTSHCLDNSQSIPNNFNQNDSSVHVQSNDTSTSKNSSPLHLNSSKEKSTLSKRIRIAGAESISDDDMNCHPPTSPLHLSPPKKKSKNTSLKSTKCLVAGCEPITDDENDTPSLNNFSNESNNDKNIKNKNTPTNKFMDFLSKISSNFVIDDQKQAKHNTSNEKNIYINDIMKDSSKLPKQNNDKISIEKKVLVNVNEVCNESNKMNDSNSISNNDKNINSVLSNISSNCLSENSTETYKNHNLLKITVENFLKSTKKELLENFATVPTSLGKDSNNTDISSGLVSNSSSNISENFTVVDKEILPDSSHRNYMDSLENKNLDKERSNKLSLNSKDVEENGIFNHNKVCLLENKNDDGNNASTINSIKNDTKNYSNIDETSTSQNINLENIKKKNNNKVVNSNSTEKQSVLVDKNKEIKYNGKNNGYPSYKIKCKDGCNNCKNIRCPKVSSCAKNQDANWSYNVRLSLTYIYCSDLLDNAIKSERIQCFCNLCKMVINKTGADLINHVVTKHLQLKNYMFKCRLCDNVKANDISVIKKHWTSKHSQEKEFVNNFIIRCQDYYVPDDFCILIASRNVAKSIGKMNSTKYTCLFCEKVVNSSLLKVHIESHIKYPLYRCSECIFECYNDNEFLEHISETYHLSSQLKNAYVELFVLRVPKSGVKYKFLGLETLISCLFCKTKLKYMDIMNHILSHLTFLNLNKFENIYNSDDIYKNLYDNVFLKCTLRMIEDDFLFAARYGLKILLENSSTINYISNFN
uniref:C2H2-type domain-containing protein n=1 Tax=Strongyloides stercoralis TaxID=6248 RepID=A0AAF5DD90_STRER